ncbi:hypothetical protein GCM10012275_54460 [Longimycelium tulufanense]|uniref:Uncharacterized protein n=1 Tax=Longimycelium tulufanense TaxID=907463 RepID=A0A8J3CHQ0_9PSEU|nr:hypothetical protein [Longimycelium tulufanense]GGM76887.1 hypothetical protein GCM10012275_54460 [Longimycelium tulufanense]
MTEIDTGLSWDDFTAYVSGLSGDAVWRQWADKQPRVVSDPQEITAITAQLRT